nr:zinc finger, CCHC-type [Tanacetum cinerariifolium]
MSSIAKFDVEKFDGSNDFGLWRVKMRGLLIQHGWEAALDPFSKTMTDAEKTAALKTDVYKKSHSALLLCLDNKGLWPEWEPCQARVRGYRDCGRGFPSANASRSVDGIRKRHVTNPRSSCCNRAVPLSVIAAAKVSHFEILGRVHGFVLTVEMDLFTFINHADPTKVLIGEREVGEGEVPLLQLTRGRVVPLTGVNDEENANIQGDGEKNTNEDDEVPAVVAKKPKVQRKRKTANGASGSSHPPKKLREDHGTSGHVGASTGGNSFAAIQELFEQSTLNVEVGVTGTAIVPFVTSSVTPISESGDGGPTNSVFVANLRTQPPYERFVISSDPYHDSSANVANNEVTFVVRSSLPPPPLMTAAIATTYCVDYEQLFAKFNVGVACQACLCAKVRLRSEHNYTKRKKFGRRCVRVTVLLKDRDAKVASLKAQLSLKEAEAAEAIQLRGQIATGEAAKAARFGELDGLKERNTALEGQVAALVSAAAIKDVELASFNTQIVNLTQELSNFQLSCDKMSIKAVSLVSEKDNLISQVSTLEGTCFGLRDEVSDYKLFKEQIEMVQDDQDGLAVCIDHGKAKRGLTEVVAYNPAAEANYVAAVSAFRDVDFPLLAHFASHKDAIISDLMDLIRLEGPAAETQKLTTFNPFLSNLCFPFTVCLSLFDDMVPLIEPLSAENLIGEASIYGVLVLATTTALSTTFVQIVFKKEEMETTPKHTTAS